MRIGDRVLLIAVMLLCVAACGYLFAILWGILPLQGLVQSLYDISDAWYYRIGVSALLLLLMAGFVKLVFVRSGSHVLLQEGIAINAAGDIRISLEAIRQMCEQVAKSDLRIELVNCSVQSSNQGLLIGIKAHCKGDQFIPLIAEGLQQNILSTLKDTCGIANAKVQVVVEKADIPSVSKTTAQAPNHAQSEQVAQIAVQAPGSDEGQTNG